MTVAPNLLVFTDLDGTLIDHDSYAWTAAKPALAALTELKAGIVMASSKTAAEISHLRKELGLEAWPAIVENGSGLLQAHGTPDEDTTEYLQIRTILSGLSDDLRHCYRGFGDMDVACVSEITGLPEEAACRAKQRAFSEPGLWEGSDQNKETFLAALADNGVMAREGGRFLTLSFGKTKADQMADLIAAYEPTYTVALGDAPNDVEMLETAYFGIIVANPHRPSLPPLAGEKSGHVTRTTAPGPEGWNTAMLELIERLNLG